MSLITQAPLWVWPLFALLLILGLDSMRLRKVPVAVIYALPALIFLAIRTLISVGPTAAGWAAFALMWMVSGWVGYRLAQGWVSNREGAFVTKKGEPLTLIAMMLIFWTNYAMGVLQATAPQVLEDALIVGCFAAVLGLASGQFAGRALWVARL